MRTYIRTKAKGGTYFFTVNLAERQNNDLLIANIALLREAFRVTKHVGWVSLLSVARRLG